MLRAERYLKVDASASEARLVVSLTLGPSEGRRVLEAADANGDGTVTGPEADGYMAQWGDGLRTDLPVTVDGEPVEVVWAEPYFDPVGAVRPTSLSVEMVARVPLDAGRHTVRVADRMRRDAFDRTDVAFRARDGAVLVASGLDPSPRDATPVLAYGPELPGPEGGLVLTSVVDVPGLTSERAVPWYAWAGGAAALALAGAAYASLRRRNR